MTSAAASSTVAGIAAVSSAATAMSMGNPSTCKLSMLLNWNTIDACFLWPSFHIHSGFTFFLTCIGSALLVVLLELSRRFQRRYDRSLRLKHSQDQQVNSITESTEERLLQRGSYYSPKHSRLVVVSEQFFRGLIHTFQFSLSYCTMLLFMYSNGYMIISILIGAAIGFALFTRDTLYLETNDAVRETKECC